MANMCLGSCLWVCVQSHSVKFTESIAFLFYLFLNASSKEVIKRQGCFLKHLDNATVNYFFFADPSLTVRADITGRYSNRLYTYEPQDLPICKHSQIILISGT